MTNGIPFAVGDLVTWFCSPRNGRLEYVAVDGRVVGVTPFRVRIRVRLSNGHLVERLVAAESLQHRTVE